MTFKRESAAKDRCAVLEQKETPDGLKDDVCGKAVEANQAGLCG